MRKRIPFTIIINRTRIVQFNFFSVYNNPKVFWDGIFLYHVIALSIDWEFLLWKKKQQIIEYRWGVAHRMFCITWMLALNLKFSTTAYKKIIFFELCFNLQFLTAYSLQLFISFFYAFIFCSHFQIHCTV